VYSNARLEGRAKYLLVDDLEKESAFKVYSAFGFEDKELVWDYIGGKIGDIVSLFEEKKRGYSEKEALERMLRDEIGRLEWIRLRILSKKENKQEIWNFLKRFREEEIIFRGEQEEEFNKLLFWVEQNILFYNPLEGKVRPQSRLLWKAIKSTVPPSF
jgi:hypothetical protein